MRRDSKVGQWYFVPGVCLCLLLFLSSCQKGSPVSVGSPTPIGTTTGTGINLQSPPAVSSTSNLTATATPNSSPTPTLTPTSTLTPMPTNQGTSSSPVPSGSGMIPSGFPHYFSFGVINSPGAATTLDEQRSQNGTAFAFRYQYLTTGVNTGHGWETWNQPPGEFATYYMQESAQHGYIPAFVYYELCPSNGPVGGLCGKQDDKQDSANITDPTVMKAYYANWALLMQKVGAFGKPVLIIVEPDLWGFMESIARGKGSGSAASVPASVSSSGYPDAAGYPNTVQGFAWALLHMRDTYARNATLAIHASSWAPGHDIDIETSSSLDVAGLAQSEAKFFNSAGLVGNPAGVSTWDLLSNDVNDPSASGGQGWWDRYNSTFPNFARYLSFISLLNQDTHRRVVMWQVPIGNQYFDTMNDSSGHEQDNRAEYILGHVANFAAAGIVGVLFGTGHAYGTANTDVMNDGVTNPAPISTYECNDCNTHVSSYPDDDGGYLRIFIGAYMKNPVMLS
jgi:hypothetical protein